MSFTFDEKLAEERFGGSSAEKRRYFAEKKELRSVLRRLQRLLTVCAEKGGPKPNRSTRMRRVMLLTLLAVALPTAALANTINLTKADTGSDLTLSTGSTFISGRIDCISMGGCDRVGPGFSLTVTGNDGTLMISGATLSPDPCSSGVCIFSGGKVTFTNPSGTLLFTDDIITGNFSKTSGDRLITSLMGSLAHGGTVSLATATIGWNGNGMSLSGAPTMEITEPSQVMEPGPLELLGAGVIGLAGMMRRKLALWT